LGGGRIQTVTCTYCKSVIDLNDEYKVLSNFKAYQEKHRLPFEIGMKGTLKTIEYIIIGRVTYQEEAPPFSEWSDFLLFSPLYGYAWLTYENGHLSYSRRNRTFPNIDWNRISNKSEIVIDGVEFKPFSDYSAEIVYVEGELTWIAKKGDETSFIDLIAPPFGISAEKTNDEIEYYKSEYMEASSVYSAFNVPQERQIETNKFNPLQPFKKPLFEVLSKISKWAIIITIFLFIVFAIDGGGDIVSTFKITNSKPVTEYFHITSTSYLTDIELKSNSSQSLKNFNIKIYKEKKLLFSINGVNAYRFNSLTNKIDTKFSTWSSNARTIAIYLKLQEVGYYQFIASPIDSSIASTIEVTIKQKEAQNGYLTLFFLLSLIGYLLYKFSYIRYIKRLQEEQSIFNTHEAFYISLYDSIINNIWLILFSIFIIFTVFKNV
jgi:hypothetical protein